MDVKGRNGSCLSESNWVGVPCGSRNGRGISAARSRERIINTSGKTHFVDIHK